MGSGQSGERATHFQNLDEKPPTEPPPDADDVTDNSAHINISNKMVERLVEDATLTGRAKRAVNMRRAPPSPRQEHKDLLLIEKLKYLDDTHSERTGLTIEEVQATAKRIAMRTAHRAQPDPVCREQAQRIIRCYNTSQPQDLAKCWEIILGFSKCVQETAIARLHARTAQEAREAARRSRHVAHAREHALKDLGPRLVPELSDS